MLRQIFTFLFFSIFIINGFAQWKTDTTNVTTGFTGISFSTPQVGFATYSNKIYKTTNGGNSWNTIKSSNSSFLEDVVATSNDSAFAFGTYGYIYFTYNSGNTWDSLYLDSSMNLLKAHGFNHDSIWFFGYNFNYTVIYKTGNGCQTIKSDTLNGLIGATGFDVMDNGRLLISGMNNGGGTKSIYYSDDDGDSWFPLTATTANQALDITSFSNDLIMHSGSFGNVYVSQNLGQTFFSRSLSNSIAYVKILEDSFVLAFHDGGNYPKIYRSTNVGDSWSAWNFPFTGNISDVEQPFKEYPELIKVSVSQYPYMYTFCNEVKTSLNSSLGFTLVCGDTTEISMGNHYSYSWNTGESSSTIQVTNPGNYWGVAENICGNKDTVYFSINQIPIPIHVSNDTLICEGDSLQLAANGGNSYSWFDMNGNQLSTDSLYSLSPTANVQIGVLIEDTTTLCYNGDTIAIDVTQAARITSSNNSICVGDTTLILADTAFGYQYNWGSGSMLNQFGLNFPFLEDTLVKLVASFGLCSFTDSVFIQVINPVRNGYRQKTFCVGDTLADTLLNGTAFGLNPSQFGFILPNGVFLFYPDSTTLYEIDFIDASGCMFKDTVELNLDTVLKSEILGLANNNLGTPLQNGLAIMVGYNANDSTVFIEDSSSISSSGVFNLTGNLSNFYVKIIPDSATNPSLMPTYFPNGAFFFSAIALQEQCKTQEITINAIQGLNPGGPGFIAGNVFQGAGKNNPAPWEGLIIVLADSLGNPLTTKTTDSTGQFSFQNLPLGTYQLWADNPKFSNNSPQSITLSADNPSLVGGVFIAVDGSLKLDYVIGIKEINAIINVVYPNPTKGFVSLKNKESVDGLRLISMEGKLLKTFSKNEFNSDGIDLSNFTNGHYFIEIFGNGTSEFQQITIAK